MRVMNIFFLMAFIAGDACRRPAMRAAIDFAALPRGIILSGALFVSLDDEAA